MDKSIVLLGSGNLATNLAIALHKAGLSIKQVYSRTEKNAKILSEKVGAKSISNLQDIEDADIYISALKDSVCHEVWRNLDLKNKLILHTSGSLNIDELSKYSTNYGVIYPLMTLSKDRIVDFKEIPILIEGNTAVNTEIIKTLAQEISARVQIANSEQRANLHLAAVWANNFSNHMYAVAKLITDKNNLPFSLLNPLIDETARKVHELDPIEAQTGPAIRFDKNIIEKQAYACPVQYQKLYREISESIHELDVKK